jgi:hypothetical protein
LGDNHIKIGTRVIVSELCVPLNNKKLSDVHNDEQPEVTGHYSSTALRVVASYGPRPALHTQIKGETA